MNRFFFRGGARPARGFILLEVLVSLAILGLALAMVLRSFTNSIKAAQRSQHLTMATLLAAGLIEKWEIEPPVKGFSRGDFGDDRKDFFYEVTYQTLPPSYENVTRIQEESRLTNLRTISLDVFFQGAREKREEKRTRLLRVETALSSSERYALGSRVANNIGFDD